MRTIAFATLGCRLNQVDSQGLQGALEARGFRPVEGGERADVVVVNTCTVTARAEASDRQAIRRLARAHPRARLVVTGCWAQTDPDVVKGLPGVDLVVGNGEKHRLPDLLEGLLSGAELETVHVSDVAGLRALPIMPAGRSGSRSRAFVKVQEGCRHRCAFCIVPRARGRSRSQDPGVVLDQVRLLVESGHVEITLTGVDLGSYGQDLAAPTTLATLLAEMVRIPGLRWVRLSSILPAYLSPALLEIVTGSDKVAPHLHIPLQSGSDRVLRRMRRPYTTGLYERVVQRLVEARPGLGLGTDVIAGHPGETEAEFAETMAVVERLPFSYLHVFPYSDRRGTEAAEMGERVDRQVVGHRSEALRLLGMRKNRAFRAGLLGSRQEVVVLETRDRDGRLVGLAGNYAEVAFEGPDALKRTLQFVRITAVRGEATVGELA